MTAHISTLPRIHSVTISFSQHHAPSILIDCPHDNLRRQVNAAKLTNIDVLLNTKDVVIIVPHHCPAASDAQAQAASPPSPSAPRVDYHSIFTLTLSSTCSEGFSRISFYAHPRHIMNPRVSAIRKIEDSSGSIPFYVHIITITNVLVYGINTY